MALPKNDRLLPCTIAYGRRFGSAKRMPHRACPRLSIGRRSAGGGRIDPGGSTPQRRDHGLLARVPLRVVEGRAFRLQTARVPSPNQTSRRLRDDPPGSAGARLRRRGSPWIRSQAKAARRPPEFRRPSHLPGAPPARPAIERSDGSQCIVDGRLATGAGELHHGAARMPCSSWAVMVRDDAPPTYTTVNSSA